MRASLILALLPATIISAAMLPRQGAAYSEDPTSTTSSDLPCPTTPANCASRANGHLICLNARTWCLYTDSTRHTPAFFPVDLDNPCAPCLVVI
ncbi:hypothetical protein ANO14919_018630 [Xylariales sp. No.14919]|nr:hypothetical protein F5X98DRAFT_326553 [Xylaria grammica]GAW12493.1 hypothetical protein ANO14919_018630 [Xylariales sp. No.14919]